MTMARISGTPEYRRDSIICDAWAIDKDIEDTLAALNYAKLPTTKEFVLARWLELDESLTMYH